MRYMMTRPQDPDDSELLLVEQANLGMQCEQFLASDVGRYLSARCEQEIREAMLALADVSPLDSETIRGLQTKIKRAQSVTQWLDEAVFAGHMASDSLLQMDEDE